MQVIIGDGIPEDQRQGATPGATVATPSGDGIPEDQKPSASSGATVTTANTGSDILDILGDAAQIIVHPHEIEVVPNHNQIFYVRELGYRELNKVTSRKWRQTSGGGLNFDVLNADNNVTAWTLHLAVVNNVGDENNPSWQPLWTIDQLLGVEEVRRAKTVMREGKPGLLDHPSESARLLIFQLLAAAWEHNPTLDPTLLAESQG